MVYWNFDSAPDTIPPITDQTPHSFIDTVRNPTIYYTCFDSLKSGNLSSIKTNCSLPAFAIGLGLFALALFKRIF